MNRRGEGDGAELTRAHRQKQMGPALLPTPLLPARGLLVRRTFQEALGLRCFHPPINWLASLPVLAPASGSSFSDPDVSRPKSFVIVPAFFRHRDRSSILVSVLKRLVSGRSLLPSIVRLPNGRPIQWISDRVLLKQPALFPAEAFVMTCLKDRVDNHHRVFWVSIFLVKSDPKALFLMEVLRPSDELKLRPKSESFKGCNPDLSTFPQITCGHEWITQRLIAKADRAQPRSRFASNLSRSAFNLMKPSASC